MIRVKMKNLLKLILILVIVIAGGYYSASFMQNKDADQELKAQLTDSSAPVEIQMKDKITLSVDEWMNESLPSGLIIGGQAPFKSATEGLPSGMGARVSGRKIELNGLSGETGEFSASISVVDSEGRSNLKNITITLESVNLTLEKLPKERADWLDKNKEPTYELIKTYDGFTLLMNWLSTNK